MKQKNKKEKAMDRMNKIDETNKIDEAGEGVKETAEQANIPEEAEAKKEDTDGAATGAKDESEDNAEKIDYEALIRADIEEIRAIFPEAAALSDISELDNPLRYAALRDLGLSPKEAYLATRDTAAPRYDNRSHLKTAVPKGATGNDGSMSAEALESARLLFSDLSDKEIQRLYKKVTK